MTDLTLGIKFEDTNSLLEWGTPIEVLAKTHHVLKEDKGDRTIYEWGEHTILNGLKLTFTTSYWNFGKEKSSRNFKSIKHYSIGDSVAKDSFERVSKHLIQEFGEPTVRDESMKPEVSLEWKFKNINIHLYFFEQHCYKCHLTITKLDN